MTDQLITLVRTYRLTPGLAERLRLAEDVFRIIEPQLRLFVFGAVRAPAAEDVFQETLKAIACGLGKFAGSSTDEFWGWCYRISRNKLNDHFRKASADRLQPMPEEELWHLLETSAAPSPLSAEDKLDFEYALDLLSRSNPDCYEYLWGHFILGLIYGEIAEDQKLNYDNVRMRIGRCLDTARSLIAEAH
jgi:RNA polymerase sigma factor (sigma-70 family)